MIPNVKIDGHWDIIGSVADKSGDSNYLWRKLRLDLVGVDVEVLVERAAHTIKLLTKGGFTYSLEETPEDEEVDGAIHIYVREDEVFWKAMIEGYNVLSYGCKSCSECGHQFDDWTTHNSNGGRKRRPVVEHPLRTGTYRILPCASCPVQFCAEFESRMAEDETKAVEWGWK
jgi:hypothetical protein